MGSKGEKLPELQVFSGIAILCVVLIHNNAIYLLAILNVQSYTQGTFMVRFLDNLISAAVSMFIFISGYKYALTNIENGYMNYAIKRIKKVLKPFVVISLIFIIINNIGNTHYLTSIRNMLTQFTRIFIGSNYAYQLWYIPMYLFISLTYPIIHKLFSNDKLRWLIILSIVLGDEILGRSFTLLANRPFNFVYYYMFFEMGLIFCNYDIRNKIKKWDILIMCVYIIAVIILTLNPTASIYSLAEYYIIWPLCVVAYYALSLRLTNNKLLNYLGKYSFYIFLFHAPVICGRISDAFMLSGIYNSIIYVFVITTLTIVGAILVYKVIEKTFLRNIVFTVDGKNKNHMLKRPDTEVYGEAS